MWLLGKKLARTSLLFWGTVDTEKQAPFHIATKNVRLEAVNVLVEEFLKKEETLDKTDKKYLMPFSYAVFGEHQEVAKHLV